MNLDSILLAMLKEPTTGYQLKSAFDQNPSHFWPAELSQIYRTLKRLEESGFLKVSTESSDRGPQRRVYRLTATGRKHLHEELAKEPVVISRQRLPYIAQLFFLHELDDLQATREFIQCIREQCITQLATYKKITQQAKAEYGGSLDDATDEAFHKFLTLDVGIRTSKARLKWCDETIEQIDRRLTKGKRKAGAKKRSSK
ncbi:MAG: PadR family transcriptional regulator [Planctomycetota bacterium]|nr:PadR family transcriptional regulator [Planctomycetota bacterium]